MTVTPLPTPLPTSAAPARSGLPVLPGAQAPSGFGALVAALLGRSTAPAPEVPPLAESRAAILGDAVMNRPTDDEDEAALAEEEAPAPVLSPALAAQLAAAAVAAHVVPTGGTSPAAPAGGTTDPATPAATGASSASTVAAVPAAVPAAESAPWTPAAASLPGPIGKAATAPPGQDTDPRMSAGATTGGDPVTPSAASSSHAPSGPTSSVTASPMPSDAPSSDAPSSDTPSSATPSGATTQAPVPSPEGPGSPAATPSPVAAAAGIGAATPTAIPATPTAPAAQAAPVAAQVFPEVTRLVSTGNGTHRLTLQLAPEALGEVRVVLTVRDGAVHVRLAAGGDAQQALLQGAPELHRLLELTGASDTRIVVRDLPTGAAPGATGPSATSVSGGAGSALSDGSRAGSGQGNANGQGSAGQHAGTRGGGSTARDGMHDGATPLRHVDQVTRARSAGLDVTV